MRGGPISRVLSGAAIYLLRTSPSASSAQPEHSAGHTMVLLFAFAPDGACQAAVLPRRWWSLTPPFQLFSQRLAAPAGVFFSAALSVGLPRLAVSQHPALWSPDFPHDADRSTPRGRLAHLARAILSSLRSLLGLFLVTTSAEPHNCYNVRTNSASGGVYSRKRKAAPWASFMISPRLGVPSRWTRTIPIIPSARPPLGA